MAEPAGAVPREAGAVERLEDRKDGEVRRGPARGGIASRFRPGPRAIWSGIPDALWNDWHWQQRERVMRLEQLERVIQVTPEERRATVQTEAQFHMGITP